MFRGFAEGVEFEALCRSFGIVRGNVTLAQNRDQNPDVTAFVSRLYQTTLGRNGDEPGLNDWTGQLLTKKNTGAGVAAGFFFSNEYKGKNKSNRDYVVDLYRAMFDRQGDEPGYNDWTGKLAKAAGFFFSNEYKGKNKSNRDYVVDLYRAMFDRQGDEPGYNDWTGKLAKGASRDYVFAGFVGSQEFLKLCEKFGITPGTYSSNQYRDQDLKKTEYVNRLFEKLLGRTGDEAGLNNNCRVLLNGGSAQDVVKSIMNSSEYRQRSNKMPREDVIQELFQALLGRGISGKYEYGLYVNGNYTYVQVAEKLMATDEFKAFCKPYGVPTSSVGTTSQLTVRINGKNYDNMDNLQIVAGMVQYELDKLPTSTELIKAQAVASHTLVMYENQNGNKYPAVSWKEPSAAVKNIVQGVIGQYLSYNGKAAYTPYYSHSSNRYNQAANTVLGGSAFPYLPSKSTEYDYLARESNKYTDSALRLSLDLTQLRSLWNTLFGTQEIPGKATEAARLTNTSTVTFANGQTRTPEALALAIDKTFGQHTAPNGEITKIVYNAGTVKWEFYFASEKTAKGVDIGMSQWTAYGLISKDKRDYKFVLSHYYPGTTLENA